MRVLKSTNLMIAGMVVLFTVGILVSSSYANIDLENAVGIWLFDEGNGDIAKDSSGNGNDGNFKGDPEWVDGKFGDGLKFDGIDDIITVPHSDELTLSIFTIAVWVNTPVVADKNWGILRKDDDTMRNYQLRIQTGPGVALLSFTSGGQPNWRDALGKIRVDDEQWHHVVATYDMEFERIYVDGVLDVQKACRDEPDTNTAPLLIGRVHGEDFMKGLIDELIILNEPLQEEDIQVLMEGLEDIAKGATVDSLEKLSTTWGSVKAQY